MSTTSIPNELQQCNQFVVWKAEQLNGRLTKVPYNAKTGRKASSTDPATWCSFEKAIEAMQNGRGYNGIGFVPSKSDLFVGIDLDHCVVNDSIEPWARDIIDRLNSYTETSPSGNGIRIFVQAKMPDKHRSKKATLPQELASKDGAFEIYSQERYLTLTTKHISKTPLTVENRQLEVEKIYEMIFGETLFGDNHTNHQNTLTENSNEQGFQGDDNKLLEKARNATNGQKFVSLFDKGDISAYGDDDSAADQALCNMLAFWCGPNPERINTLFRRSELSREKWLKREDYRQRTIDKALRSCKEVYGNKAYNLTDTGNAERFAIQHGNKVRYCWSTGRWYYYDGQRWSSQKGIASANRRAINTVRNILVEASKIEDEDRRKTVTKWAFQSEKASCLVSMLTIARSLPPITAYGNNFDTDNYLLNVLNGTIDLRSGQLKPHNPYDMITQLAPVSYPAEQEQASIKLWLDCLNTWHRGDKEAIDYLQRLAGMCLTGDISSRCFPIFYGGGKNGKSGFLDTLMMMLGDYATIAPRTLLKVSRNEEHATELACLMGKRLVIASETKKSMKLKVALIKAMTGDAKMKARFMRQDYFDFQPTHKIILMTQNLPVIDEASDAIWDRVHKMEWAVRIPDHKQNTRLLEDLKAEWPGILKWAVDGCLKWQKDGILIPTESIRQQTEEYRAEMNPIKAFIDDNCIIGPELFIAVTELRQHYDTWGNINDMDDRLSVRDFNTVLSESGYKRVPNRMNGKVVKCWQGISIANETVDEDDLPI